MNPCPLLEDRGGTEGRAESRWYKNVSQGGEGKDIPSSDIESASLKRYSS